MSYICGIDEAGRGPIAGPVTAAAVLLPENFPVEILKDSKKLSPERRAFLSSLIREQAAVWGLGWCSPKEIDRINILQASLTAMARAFYLIKKILKNNNCIDYVLVDGNQFPPIDEHLFAVVRGDGAVPEIMAASILAKEARDNWMRQTAKRYPQWQFERHKGYPTKLHRELCIKHGLSPIHRKTFKIFS